MGIFVFLIFILRELGQQEQFSAMEIRYTRLLVLAPATLAAPIT